MTTAMKGLLTRAELETVVRDFAGDLLSLALLDIDNFKGANDTYGHAPGDTVFAFGNTSFAEVVVARDARQVCLTGLGQTPHLVEG